MWVVRFAAVWHDMPSQKDIETPNHAAVTALSLIHLFGLNSMCGLVYRNGYLKAFLQLRDHGPYVLPGLRLGNKRNAMSL